ncbi:PAS domain-containing protein [Desulforhopalus sp. 52FAK]
MDTQEEQNTKLIQQISDEKLINALTPEKKQDVMSIVFDAINSLVGGVIITDKCGGICFANPSFCKMFGYNQKEIIGKNAAELFTTSEVTRFSDVIEILDISKNTTEEFIVQNSDGATFVVEVSVSNVTSEANQVLGRMASFVDITSRKEIENDRENLINKLQNALDTIKVLKGILPICSYCKKIRDDKGAWDQMEAYLSEYSDVQFSHGVCPDCYKKVMDGLK